MLYINDKRGDKSSNMSNSLSDCCNPCNTVPPVQIPGAQGPQGPAGAAGSDGTDAFSIVQSPGFTIPTVGNDVLVPVNQTQWMTTNAIVIASTGFGGPVTGPANFRIISINSATTVTLRALAYPGDAVNPATIATGALIAAAGLQGPTGTAGSTFPTTTKGDTMFDDGANNPNPHVIRLPIGGQGQSVVADPFNATPGLVLPYKGVTSTLFTSATGANTIGNTAETNLLSFNILANQWRNPGDVIEFESVFNVASTANNATKQIKLYLGGLAGSVIIDTAALVLDGGSIVFRGSMQMVTGASELGWSTSFSTNAAGTSVTFNYITLAGQNTNAPLQLLWTGKNGTAFANGIVQLNCIVNYRGV